MACDGSTVDGSWCPEHRDRSLISDPDQVGVHVVRHVDSATGILPVDDLTIARDAVMTLEPVTG